jgi:gliding motility-associated lipoprotein GldD
MSQKIYSLLIKSVTLLIFVSSALIMSCKPGYTPKPRGFYRIDFPEKKYKYLNSNFPYQFQIPVYSEILPDRQNPDNKDWINVTVPQNKAEVHISYYELPDSKENYREILARLIEESRTLAYKHSIKASSIDEKLYINRSENVFGTVYRIEGNAASPIQFFLTDSTRHFLRGALYIRSTPDIDSLKPVIDFLEADVIRIIESTTWN